MCFAFLGSSQFMWVLSFIVTLGLASCTRLSSSVKSTTSPRWFKWDCTAFSPAGDGSEEVLGDTLIFLTLSPPLVFLLLVPLGLLRTRLLGLGGLEYVVKAFLSLVVYDNHEDIFQKCSLTPGCSSTGHWIQLIKINAVFGTPKDRWFRVEWLGHPGKDSWEPERSLTRQGCEESIKTFWSNTNTNPSEEFVPDPDEIWRCWTCDKGYKSISALKVHITRTHAMRRLHGTTADRDARAKQHVEAQVKKCHVVCDGRSIENVWWFKYLGSRFRVDDDQIVDVRARIAVATVTAGKMRSIWTSKSIPVKFKLWIYKTGFCSRLTYGSEVWSLETRTCTMINGANSRMAGRTDHQQDPSWEGECWDEDLWYFEMDPI